MELTEVIEKIIQKAVEKVISDLGYSAVAYTPGSPN